MNYIVCLIVQVGRKARGVRTGCQQDEQGHGQEGGHLRQPQW